MGGSEAMLNRYMGQLHEWAKAGMPGETFLRAHLFPAHNLTQKGTSMHVLRVRGDGKVAPLDVYHRKEDGTEIEVRRCTKDWLWYRPHSC